MSSSGKKHDFDESETVLSEGADETEFEAYPLQGRPVYIDELKVAVRLPRPRHDSLWVLASEDGLVVGKAYAIAQHCLIGRDAKCHVQLLADSVSRIHARIERSDDSVTLVDNSTNGVLLSAKRVSGRAKLVNGDTIQVARTVFEVVLMQTGA